MPLFGRKVPPQPSISVPTVQSAEPEIEWGPSGHAGYSDGHVHFKVNTIPEAKLALQDLRLKKREITAAKRVFSEQERELRASYIDQVRHRAPTMRGRGTFGRVVRTVQQVQRAQGRAHLADALRPYETRKRSLVLT